MRVLLFGATGNIGREIARELLDRGHQVTGATRSGNAGEISHANFTATAVDATDADRVADAAIGHDAIASAVGPGWGSPDFHEVVDAARGLIGGARRSGVSRLVVVGGAGSLEVAPGTLLLDTPQFMDQWKPAARGHLQALEVFRAVTDLDWTFISPAPMTMPGERTGRYRIGGDELLSGPDGMSRLSNADYAVAFVDVLESKEHLRRRIGIAY